ncbi:MAG: ArsR family transcriptional regulator [Mucilaginibacter sp.]|nr:ArsR family transcriptional regulator [Mucilaginibacter sp.]
MRRDVFQAIADPNRRAILGLLAGNKLNVNQVAEHFAISRPAVSQHMKILTECGLVAIYQKGNQRYCQARMEKLSEVWDWLNQYTAFWNDKFNAMEKLLKELQTKNKEDAQ